MDGQHESTTRLIPRMPAPVLRIPLVEGGEWDLRDQIVSDFTLIAFYRGLHCPICSRYVAELDSSVPRFDTLGTKTFCVSMDSLERARAAKQDWKLAHLPLGFGLSVRTALEWGLFLSAGMGSTAAGIEEPAVFTEPAIFIIKSNGELYYSSVQTMPFARPDLTALADAIDLVKRRNYPARGNFLP